jgi:glycine/D-amino acid oxidase-like deaminating enzyme
MAGDTRFHPDFKPRPLWWEACEPQAATLVDMPRSARVAIVGGGYAGLAAALELSKRGIDSVVLEAQDPGFGASTRNAGFVCSYGNLSRRYGKKQNADPAGERERHADALSSAVLVQSLIREENIDCFWSEPGHFIAAWTRRHYAAMAAKVAHLNALGDWGAALVAPESVGEELGSDFYPGGMTIARSGLIHPALYYAGLLAACRRRGVIVCARAPVIALKRAGSKWHVETGRGDLEAGEVIIATNGYTGALTPQFQRRLVPIGSYMIATEALPEGLVRQLIPRGRSVYDSRRVLSYCRPAPDGRRLIFGGRVRFRISDPLATALPLYTLMIQRFPQLSGCRITHAWTGTLAFTFDEASHMGQMDGLHYALGCNGTGIAMMTYLGTQTARRIAGAANAPCSFEGPEFPTSPFYNGNPWFVPLAGEYFKFRDWLDRRRSR